MTSKSEPNQLSVVAHEFAQWRSSKKSGERIPDRLWTLAASLVGKFKVSHITKTLSINSAQYKQHIIALGNVQQISPTLLPVNVPNQAISSSARLSPHHVAETAHLCIERCDGVKISINNVSEAVLMNLVNSLLEK